MNCNVVLERPPIATMRDAINAPALDSPCLINYRSPAGAHGI